MIKSNETIIKELEKWLWYHNELVSNGDSILEDANFREYVETVKQSIERIIKYLQGELTITDLNGRDLQFLENMRNDEEDYEISN
jgi:hypothetical protein